MSRHISSDDSHVALPPSASAWRTLRCATWPSTGRTSAAIWCRATKASSSCAAWIRCAKVSIDCRRASTCSLGDAASREAERAAVRPRVLLRLLEIQRVLLRHGLDDYARATHLYRPLRFLFFLSPGIWFARRRRDRGAARLRLALE